jgi:hypothetical protein
VSDLRAGRSRQMTLSIRNNSEDTAHDRIPAVICRFPLLPFAALFVLTAWSGTPLESTGLRVIIADSRIQSMITPPSTESVSP